MIENVMEHLAHDIGMDPLEFRLKNLVDLSYTPTGESEANILPTIIPIIKSSSEYDQRKVQIDEFNAQNRWKKRGLSLVPMIYGQYDYTAKFHILLSIYQGDGTISISCGAVEMGQGKVGFYSEGTDPFVISSNIQTLLP